ncbi:MAG: bifunctional 5,10-methylenetetrahydrofolate dehydrogenase/5,10-methenyltetrahydrofolate cyclohydrolase [Candidatus Omnitrophica bacterium]|nr:bifunctional 5,10-methylenetetrahydrofolate dehydrogenase/5,10-methenyltetrahydrofolate cyclohydrolase [Candidatus Omnitrophota bacterium]
MENLLEGKPIAERIKNELRAAIATINKPIVLASVHAGENGGADAYVRSQQKTAKELGITYQLHRLNGSVREEEVIECVQALNADNAVNGIIVQMPLPPHVDYTKISASIVPGKDVEGMCPENIGKLLFGAPVVVPCTAAAVMEIIKSGGIDLCGKETVVVGHSEIVGKPLALLLLEELATVTVCHIGTSKAGKLEEHVEKADVLIVAVGKAGLIHGEWVKEGAVVIDVGINREKGKIVGDVEFETAAQRASLITPVPGGVGPLTVTMLMRNLVSLVTQGNA